MTTSNRLRSSNKYYNPSLFESVDYETRGIEEAAERRSRYQRRLVLNSTRVLANVEPQLWKKKSEPEVMYGDRSPIETVPPTPYENVQNLYNLLHPKNFDRARFIKALKQMIAPKVVDSVEDFPKLTKSDKELCNKRNQADNLNRHKVDAIDLGVTNTRSDYYTIPDIDTLRSDFFNTEDRTCIVPHFTIGRTGFGNVSFDGPLDVANLNIDKYVHFRMKEVELYPGDVDKPEEGVGLNRPAQITIDHVWPLNKATHENITDAEQIKVLDFDYILKRICIENSVDFVEYRVETGSWVFRVKSF